MHIVFVSREYVGSNRAGGIASYVATTAKALLKQNVQVTVVAASDNDKRAELNDDGVRILFLEGADFCTGRSLFDRIRNKVRSFAQYYSYRLRVLNEIVALHAREPIDYIEFPEYGAEAFLFALRKFDFIKWGVRLHGPTGFDRNKGRFIRIYENPWRWFQTVIEMSVLKQAFLITSPSKAMADEITKKCSISKITVIPNAINVDFWKRDSIPEQVDRVFFAGSITKEKGCFVLLDALLKLRERGINLDLLMVGKQGRDAMILQSTKSKLGLDWFQLKPPVPPAELAELYSSSKVVAFPSLWEPFGLVCIEAMASGAIVVGSLHGGMVEIIENGVDGFVIDPHNMDLFVSTLCKVVLMDQVCAAKIRSDAVLKVAKNYDASEIASIMIDEIRGVKI